MPQSPSSSSSSEARIRAVLEQCLRWHNGDKYREDPDEANRAAWEDHKHLLENTLASLAATPPSLPIDFKQASELLAMFGGEAGLVTLSIAEGHSGRGLYAHSSGYLEDGAAFLGAADEEAVPGKQASEQEDSPSDRYLRREITWNEYQAISEEAANRPSDTSSTAASSPRPDEAAPKQASEQGGWLPIATAPKDGLWQDGHNHYSEYVLVWYPGAFRPLRARWWYRDDKDANNFLADGGWAVFPTVWQPLPIPPSPHPEEGALLLGGDEGGKAMGGAA